MRFLLSHRRGVELSINFLVTFVLAIVLFGLGMLFARNLFAGSQELVDLSQDQLDTAIESMYCTANELVCLSLTSKTLERGVHHIFGVTVLNALDTADFRITITNTKRIEKDGTLTDLASAADSEKLDILPEEMEFSLERNRDDRKGFLIRALSSNPKGKYIVDVDVWRDGEKYDTTHKIYVTVV